MKNIYQNLTRGRGWHNAAWLISLILVLGLGISGVKAGSEATREVLNVRGLLLAGASLNADALANPFVCLRGEGNIALSRLATENFSDYYLEGVGLCLSGETEAGLTKLEAAGSYSNADVQYAAGLIAEGTKTGTGGQAGANVLADSGITGNNLIVIVQKLASQADLDPFPALRLLAEKAGDDPRTWSLWLQGSAQLAAAKGWQAALNWLNEGLTLAPKSVQSSLTMQIGRIYQIRSDDRNYQAALEAYKKAFEEESWIYPADEVTTHIYRGDIYRTLTEEYSPEQAIKEYEEALKLQPENYWALLSIGHVYLNDIKDLDLAEDYYRQALVANEKSPYAYLYIGDVYRARGDNKAAEDWYRRALDHQANWQPALDRLDTLNGK